MATLSRKARKQLAAAFEKSVDPALSFLLDSRLHDFGFRGCTCVEQSVIGGSAHLLNFTGSDTMSAAYYVQFELNEGRPIAESIPATEHSVMTAYRSEREAMENMIRKFGGENAVFACVMDSYDYARALSQVLPSVAALKTEKGGFLVLRPDSGNPVEVILMALRAGERIFGVDVNSKGYKVVRNCGAIQGDGINLKTLGAILEAVLAAGYSAQCVAFGMGAGLLQKVNRDTMSFATKLSHIVYADGTARYCFPLLLSLWFVVRLFARCGLSFRRLFSVVILLWPLAFVCMFGLSSPSHLRSMLRNVMKAPKTDASKVSLPGELAVVYNEAGVPMVYPKNAVPAAKNALRTIWKSGPVADFKWDNFDVVRQRVEQQFTAMPAQADVVSAELKALIATTREEQIAFSDKALEGTAVVDIN